MLIQAHAEVFMYIALRTFWLDFLSLSVPIREVEITCEIDIFVSDCQYIIKVCLEVEARYCSLVTHE